MNSVVTILRFWFVILCGLVDTNVSKKHAVSIFSSEVNSIIFWRNVVYKCSTFYEFLYLYLRCDVEATVAVGEQTEALLVTSFTQWKV